MRRRCRIMPRPTSISSGPRSRVPIPRAVRNGSPHKFGGGADRLRVCMVTLSSVGSEEYAGLGAIVRNARGITLERLEAPLAGAVKDGEIVASVDLRTRPVRTGRHVDRRPRRRDPIEIGGHGRGGDVRMGCSHEARRLGVGSDDDTAAAGKRRMVAAIIKRLRLQHRPVHTDGDQDRNVSIEAVAGHDHACLAADPLFGEVPYTDPWQGRGDSAAPGHRDQQTCRPAFRHLPYTATMPPDRIADPSASSTSGLREL